MLADTMVLRRFRAPAGASGHSLTPTAKTLGANLETEAIRRLIELTDQWASQLGVKAIRSANSTIRKKVGKKKAAGSQVMGIHMPIKLADEINGLALKHARSVSFILAWSVECGVKALTAEGLIEAYPQTKPSLNLTSLLALHIGLKKFKRAFAVREGAPENAELLQSVVSRSAETQRISQHWTKTERASIAKRLERKAKMAEDERRRTAIRIVASLVERESADFLERMRPTIEAELDETTE